MAEVPQETNRLVQFGGFLMFPDFREMWGLPTKPIHRCPICGVETKKGRQCATHKARERNVRRGRVKPYGAELGADHRDRDRQEPEKHNPERDDVGAPQ